MLDRLTLQVNRGIVADLAAAGFPEVRVAHSKVFENLRHDGSTASELAEAGGMTKQSMGELVDHLERHGIVRRVADPTDGRARRVHLTRRGDRVVGVAREALERIHAEWKAELGPRRFADLSRALAILVRDEDVGMPRPEWGTRQW